MNMHQMFPLFDYNAHTNEYFQNIKGCVVVNPERMAKGQVGGTFARIEVSAAADGGIWATETHVSAQVVKI